MADKYINTEALEKFSVEHFQKNWPFPWHEFNNFLYDEAFLTLLHEFPPIELFEYAKGYERFAGQRPHDRYYLGYETTVYRELRKLGKDRGIAQHEQLPKPWQEFIEEIREHKLYRETILKALQCEDFDLRFDWHMGRTSNEVSPHTDASTKLGSHLCYFNLSSEWDPSWGGQLELLANKTTGTDNPEFSDFLISIPIQITDNHSLLFKRTRDSWHGVQALQCPEGKYRKLFNIIFEKKEAQA